MLLSVMGSQGSGKSTILQRLNEKGYPTVERKTSRSILNEWGVSLSEVNNHHDLTVKFQEEILKRKFEDEQFAVDSPQVWFTERTYVDLFVYALVSLGKDNEHNNWLNDYYKRCMAKMDTYSHIFYLQGGLFSVEHDGVRGVNRHYSRMVDDTMFRYLRDGLPMAGWTYIDIRNLEQRVEMILSYVQNAEIVINAKQRL